MSDQRTVPIFDFLQPGETVVGVYATGTTRVELRGESGYVRWHDIPVKLAPSDYADIISVALERDAAQREALERQAKEAEDRASMLVAEHEAQQAALLEAQTRELEERRLEAEAAIDRKIADAVAKALAEKATK
ncbi:MAG: hypothetical protein HC933_14245 [Pleurocapsa sp. SU_196_0]|nr:hypothetical protein [Pleurocapsa sp. SU_196_0]